MWEQLFDLGPLMYFLFHSFLLPEEFNDKILSPELNDTELRRLHGEVLHIYETYCLDESIDKINFDKFIVEEIRNSEKPSL